ncbi:MAG: VWA domain-containing protein [Spirochaetales bacterium]|nr:VWA domain-containing protein [Spirochaetales bacterium]
MKHKIQQMVNDMKAIDPSLEQKELENIVRLLLKAKPHVKMDKEFKNRLKIRIFERNRKTRSFGTIIRPPNGFFNWFANQRLKLAAAASVFSLLLIAAVIFLPLFMTYQAQDVAITEKGLTLKREMESPTDSDFFKTEKQSGEPESGSTEQTLKDETASEITSGEKRTIRGATLDTMQLSDKETTSSVIIPEEAEETLYNYKELLLEKDSPDYPRTEKRDDNDKGFEPKSTPGVEGQVPPSYKDLGGLGGDIGMEGPEPLPTEDTDSIMGLLDDGATAPADLKRSKEESEKKSAFSTEEYDRIYENDFLEAIKNPQSTFSIDVDTASYSNVRRFLKTGSLPPPDAVRIEELINYFDYDYAEPKAEQPFSFFTEIGECPWNPQHKLLHIGIRGRSLDMQNAPANNLVFLLDVSGSMDYPDKLPLLKQSIAMLIQHLRPKDRIAIVVYAGAAGLVLPSTKGDNQEAILEALYKLEAGGTTAGGAGIVLAYETARQSFIAGGNNRVILATDGDFNVGTSSDAELVRLIEEKRDQGIYLTVLGFGTGNYKDAKMEKLADKGNGNYAYIDSLMEAKKVLVYEMSGTLYTIAKDVKLQVEFNPARVHAYRLLGYENRMLKAEDFADDRKDAGELGAGHTVTALYEIIPETGTVAPEKLKYQSTTVDDQAYASPEIMTLRFRYKKPDQDKSLLIEVPVLDDNVAFEDTSTNFRFSAAVAEWGLLLRNSQYKADANFSQVKNLAESAQGDDPEGLRAEFLKLLELSEKITLSY